MNLTHALRRVAAEELRHRLVPERTGLVIFDMLECYRARIERLEQTEAVDSVQWLLGECRSLGCPIFFACADHRPDGADANPTLTDTDAEFNPWEGPQPLGSPPDRTFEVLKELAPRSEEYEIPKHRWNAFYQTHLDLSLRTRGVDTILLAGGSTHVGIASTAFGARDMDYQVVIVRDGLTGYEPQRSFFVDKVFPRMCRVRSADEIRGMFSEPA
jgi:nicotinamidase-related amidase